MFDRSQQEPYAFGDFIYRTRAETTTMTNVTLRVRRYDSFGEWLRHAEWCAVNEKGAASLTEYVNGDCSATAKWLCGTWGSVARGLDAIRDGEMPRGAVEKMEAWRDRISLEIDAPTLGNTRRRHFTFADEGDEVDPDRFNSGHDRSWRTMRRGRVQPIIRLGIDATAVASMEDEAFDRIGGLAGAVCDVLTRQGRSVEVALMESELVKSGSRCGAYLHLCTLKAAHEPMDLAKVAAIATPVFSRFVCSLTDHFDAGQYHYALKEPEMIKAARMIGLDALIGRYTKPADVAAQLLVPAEVA